MSDDVEDNNQLRSALWSSTNANRLINGASETDERGQAYRKWFEQEIVDNLTGAELHISANNADRFPLQIARRIAGRAFPFCMQYKMVHLLRYTSCITTDMTWIGVEGAELLRSGAMSAALPSRLLAEVILCHF